MRLSIVFKWRGKVRYWDPVDRRVGVRAPQRRKYKIEVRGETYDVISRLAAERGISRREMLRVIAERIG